MLPVLVFEEHGSRENAKLLRSLRFKANANSIQRPILILLSRVRTVTPSLIIYVFVLSFELIHMQIRNGVYERVADAGRSKVDCL